MEILRPPSRLLVLSLGPPREHFIIEFAPFRPLPHDAARWPLVHAANGGGGFRALHEIGSKSQRGGIGGPWAGIQWNRNWIYDHKIYDLVVVCS